MTAGIVIAFILLLGTTGTCAVLAARGRKVDMQEWAIGGRSFGGVLVWFLSAGEIYTTFAFLGGSGLLYAEGAPAFYILANVPLAYTIGYWLLPRIWNMSRRHDFYTQGEYFHRRFNTRWLQVLVALVAIIGLVSYTQLQLTGLSTILGVLFGGAISKTVAVGSAGLFVLVFTFTAGLRSTALASVIKDVLVVSVLAGVVVTIARMTGFGSITAMLHRASSEHPHFALLPGMKAPAHGPAWFMSTILLTNFGYWMLPHLFQANCSAKDLRTIRRNAVFQPLYGLSYAFVFLVGLAALLTIPGLHDSNSALVSVVARFYPGWFVGVLAGTAMLVAVVPAAALLLTIGTQFSQNIVKPLRPRSDDRTLLLAARMATVVVTVIACMLALKSVASIVSIILVMYGAIAQIAPGFLLSLLWRRVTAWGVATGIFVGVLGVSFPPAEKLLATIPGHANAAIYALVINVVLVVVVSYLTPRPHPDAVAVGLDERPEPALRLTSPA
jgi:solute:Na+ symporter, SSS family